MLNTHTDRARLYEVTVIHEPPGGAQFAELLLEPTPLLATAVDIHLAARALKIIRDRRPDLPAYPEHIRLYAREFLNPSVVRSIPFRMGDGDAPGATGVIDFTGE